MRDPDIFSQMSHLYNHVSRENDLIVFKCRMSIIYIPVFGKFVLEL